MVSYHQERAKTDEERSAWTWLVKWWASHGTAASVAALMLSLMPLKPVYAGAHNIAHNVLILLKDGVEKDS